MRGECREDERVRDLKAKAEFEERLRQRDDAATERRHGGQDVAEEHAPLDKGLNFREKVRARCDCIVLGPGPTQPS